MKAEYVNPFYQATKEVFKLMLDLDVSKAQLEALKHSEDKTVSVTIGITGDLNGTITYTFPEEMILEMVKIMSGMEFQAVDSFVTSALGEVSNIICGNATSGLCALNYNCDITPPRITVGRLESVQENASTTTIPLQTDIGVMTLSITLYETEKVSMAS